MTAVDEHVDETPAPPAVNLTRLTAVEAEIRAGARDMTERELREYALILMGADPDDTATSPAPQPTSRHAHLAWSLWVCGGLASVAAAFVSTVLALATYACAVGLASLMLGRRR